MQILEGFISCREFDFGADCLNTSGLEKLETVVSSAAVVGGWTDKGTFSGWRMIMYARVVP